MEYFADINSKSYRYRIDKQESECERERVRECERERERERREIIPLPLSPIFVKGIRTRIWPKRKPEREKDLKGNELTFNEYIKRYI